MTIASSSHTPRDPSHYDHESSAEDLGEDVLALATVANSQRPASVLRRVNGRLVRLIVEAA